MATDSPNYCQHPECHNSRVAWYVESYPNRSSSDTRPWLPDGLLMSWAPKPAPWRRWCQSHALIFEKAALG